ncbi:hypothetical protein QCA50_013837 [Cerrena zonata]|uniref:Uncharacterized protein n=1 Tax=Cerrena zonata TaxID=2478898 RepID=A0AAW0FVQ4_9APHY
MNTATSGILMNGSNALEGWDRVKEIISRLRAVEEEEEDKEDEEVFSNRSPDSERMSDA